MNAYAGIVAAPEFPPEMEWLNTDHPLTLKQLRGKVVLLDFWTYCCINCMHILPDLKRLERKYEKELVVIGVHSAKFTAEQDTQNIRQAILRYEIEHPVVNDHAMEIWRSYAVRAWPTVYVIDPNGKIVGFFSGEGVYEPADRLIRGILEHFDAKGLVNREPLAPVLERSRMPESLLSFPGKVFADEKSGRLFISDSNHHRIVVARLGDGFVEAVVGAGEPGLRDGSFTEAQFQHPQGLVLYGNNVYVADTNNHAVRRIDLDARTVTTIAGTGAQGGYPPPDGPGPRTPLNSPWDVCVVQNILYIAMAGSHQLYRLDLATGHVAPYAGSGREALVDGPLERAALAQPSGLASDGRRLYFADSEVSAVRYAELPPGRRVGTLVGRDLFVFGDHDGRGDAVRLQHPLGVYYAGGTLYVTDTYNNKIKSIDPDTRECRTLYGTGEEGYRDGESPLFDEPGGLSGAGGKLYIADTNNHVIRVADLSTKRVETFRFANPDVLRGQRPPVASALSSPSASSSSTLPLAAIRCAPGATELRLTMRLPSGYALAPDAPSRWTLSVKGDGVITPPQGRSFPLALEIRDASAGLPVLLATGTTRLRIEGVIYYCEKDREKLCYFTETAWETSLTVENDAPALPVVEIPVSPVLR